MKLHLFHAETPQLSAQDVSDTDRLLEARFKRTSHFTLFSHMQYKVLELTERPYLNAAYDAAAMVAIFGTAGFRTTHIRSTRLVSDENGRRRLMLQATSESIGQNADGKIGRPVWAAPSAATYLQLTGEKCWDEAEEELMAEDSMTLLEAQLSDKIFGTLDDNHRLSSAASTAADFKVITGNTSWDDEFNVSMATAALNSAEGYYVEGQPETTEASISVARRIASARILMASHIDTIQGNPNKGIELIF